MCQNAAGRLSRADGTVVTPSSRKALILPGAGARGAYQVGVLRAIAELLPRNAATPFSVLSGSSAGAINAVVLASRAVNFRRAVMALDRVWGAFRTNHVFRADNWTLFKSSLHWFGALVLGGLGRYNPRGLLDNSPLRELLERSIPFTRIDQAIDAGLLDALAVTASAYTSARSVTFVQGSPSTKPWARVRRIGRPATIGLDHLMASSSVPFVFPPVRVGGEFYGDGSIRHLAPLSPAIHLGADRLLVVGVRDEHEETESPADSAQSTPSLAHLAGHMLDTLFMDGLYADLERATRLNAILEHVDLSHLGPPLANLRPLKTLIIVPTEDLREVAARHVGELPYGLRLLLRGLGALNRQGMQFVSYLLFESGFTRELIAMGYSDAMNMRPQLEAFLFDEPGDDAGSSGPPQSNRTP